MTNINLQGYYNRYNTDPNYKNYKRLLFRAQKVIQSAELNEMQDVILNEVRRFAGKLLVNGQVVSGCKVAKNFNPVGKDANGNTLYNITYTIYPGVIFYDTYFIDTPQQTITLENVNLDTFEDELGVIIEEKVVTESDDNMLLNPAVESKNYGQPGAARLAVTAKWELRSRVDTNNTTFIGIYKLKADQVIIEVDPAPWMKDIINVVAEYDRDANGNYVVDGYEIEYSHKDSPLGPFYIDVKEGVANVYGFKFRSDVAQEVEVPPLVDFEVKMSEPITFTGTGWYPTRHIPIRKVYRVSGVKQTIEQVDHQSGNGKDELEKQPVLKILKVWQGEKDNPTKVFEAGVDYKQEGDFVDWSLDGDEPQQGDSYWVEYQYQYTETLEGGFSSDGHHTLGAIGDNFHKVYLFGFVPNTTVTIDYDFVLQRKDLIFLNSEGKLGVIKGIPDEFSPHPPRIDNKNSELLQLGYVTLGEDYDPVVENDAQRVFKMSDIGAMLDEINTLRSNVAKLALAGSVKENEPAAKFKDTFSDDFNNDNLRDMQTDTTTGILNDAITQNGHLILDIDWASVDAGIETAPNIPGLQLPIVNKRIMIDQPYWTKTRLVVPYVYRQPPNAHIRIWPRVYRWIDKVFVRWYYISIYLGTRTYFHTRYRWCRCCCWGTSRSVTTYRQVSTSRWTTTYNTIGRYKAIVPRINIRIWSDYRDFNSNEKVDIWVDNKYAGTLTTDSNGRLNGTFRLPANIYSGTREVKVKGQVSKVEGQTQFKAIPLVRHIHHWNITYWRWIRHIYITRWRWWDPTSQTFQMKETAPIAGIGIYFDKKPEEDVAIFLTETIAGVPDRDKILAQVTLTPDQVKGGGQETYVEFPFKPTLIKDHLYAFIVITKDIEATLQCARMGERDNQHGIWITKNPYPEGTLNVSSNQAAWTPIQDEDLRFRIYIADFAKSKTYTYPVVNVENATDLIINTGVKIHKGTNVSFKCELLDRTTDNVFTNLSAGLQFPIPLKNDQPYSGRVRITALLESDGDFSPSVESNLQLSVGTCKNVSYYTSRAIDVPDEAKYIVVYFDGYKPQGSDIIIEYGYEDTDGSYKWVEIPFVKISKDLGYGWAEYKHQVEFGDNFPPKYKLRYRITLKTTDRNNRPVMSNFRASLAEIV